MKFSKAFIAIFISAVLCLEFLTTFAVNISTSYSLSIDNQDVIPTIPEYGNESDDISIPLEYSDDVETDDIVSVPLLDSEMAVINSVSYSNNAQTQSLSLFDYKILSFAVDATNHTVTAIIKLTSNAKTELKFNLHSGLYTGNGALGGYNISPLNFSAGETKLVTVKISNASKKTVNTLKLFFWDDNMHPLCEPISKSFNYVSTASQSITFTNPTPVINYKFGTTYQLKCTINPSNYSGGITFKSTDTSVASVNQSGLVTGYKSGTTIITAATSDGGAFAYCTLTVNNEQISVSLNREIINMWNGYTYKLKPTTAPVNG
ncbi:MAG: Ig-like domain-containing protein, partial [Clostridia bacterium]|nr:Ig-like domain-containing protein [Clostridia bacterium]